MFVEKTSVFAACVVLVLGLIGCAGPATTAPTAVPQMATVVVTSVVTATPEPTPTAAAPTVEPTPIVVTATNTPIPPTETPVPPTETPTPSVGTPRPRPSATPTSAGPLSFPEPMSLDNWQPLADDGFECTIIVRITGGASPYTIYHDLEAFTTSETTPAIVFKAQGCSAIVHTITVESADGQAVSHDYSIPPPWCK